MRDQFGRRVHREVHAEHADVGGDRLQAGACQHPKRLVVRRSDRVGRRIGIFYSLNVAGSIFGSLAAGFLLGVTAQSIKLCVDTLVQAHVDDAYKGRVFVLYDMVFNVALVVAAAIGALILPANGVSVPVVVGVAVTYALLGVWFTLVTRDLALDRGTESLRTATPTPDSVTEP